jgi:benzoyl-CoA reductase/2-hydroxyglutaryl-CoA dehydratase subunit BcrC/BadD/HgdB
VNKIIKKFGDVVSKEVYANPGRARRLLTTAYSLNGWKDARFGGSGLAGAYAQMNAVVSRYICHAFQHPHSAVMVNVFFPCEILHAMDITPMFPEALSVYIANTACEQVFADAAENADVPESFCSYHKIMIGLAETGVLPKPLLIANTTLACDANQLSFRRLAQELQIPHVVVDVPNNIGDDAVNYVAEQLRSVTAALEDVCHRKMNEDRLRATMCISDRSIKTYREYLELRANCSMPVTMSGELFSLSAVHVFLGTPQGEQFINALREAAEKAPKSRSKKRILWLHTLPNWQDSMKAIFDKSERCEIVGCDMTYDVLCDMNPDEPYESMAKRVVYNINNGGAQRRIEAAIEYAKKLHADGVLVFCHWGCKQTQGMAQMAKKTLEAEGFPVLVLDGDGCDSRNVSDGQMVTRVNAFLEQLEGMK